MGDIECMAFADDLTITGKPDDLVKALIAFKVAASGIELEVQPMKCQLIDFHHGSRSVEIKQSLADLNIKVKQTCAIVLNCPIGTSANNEFEFMKSKLASQLSILDVLQNEDISIHQASTILRVSTIHKLDYWMRTVDPGTMRNIASTFDVEVMKCYRNKLAMDHLVKAKDTKYPEFEKNFTKLIRTPISLGGDGMLEATKRVNSCFIGGIAIAISTNTVANAFRNYNEATDNPNSTMQAISTALSEIRKQCTLPEAAKDANDKKQRQKYSTNSQQEQLISRLSIGPTLIQSHPRFEVQAASHLRQDGIGVGERDEERSRIPKHAVSLFERLRRAADPAKAANAIQFEIINLIEKTEKQKRKTEEKSCSRTIYFRSDISRSLLPSSCSAH